MTTDCTIFQAFFLQMHTAGHKEDFRDQWEAIVTPGKTTACILKFERHYDTIF